MVTLVTDFQDYTPAYNPIEAVLSSTNSGEDSFRYIFDLYFAGQPVITFKVNPEPTTGNRFGIKDFHKIVESKVKAFINRTPDLSPVGMTQMDGGIVEYHVEYGEEYDVAGTITEFTNQVTGTTKYSWEASLTFNEFTTYDFNDFDLDSSGDWLTSIKTNCITRNQSGYAGVVTSLPDNVDFIQIKTYDVNNVLIDTYRAVNPVNPSTPAARF